MKVSVLKVERGQPEQVLIHCHQVSDEVLSIVRFVKSAGTTLPGYLDERMTQIPLEDIFYVEAVDDRVFANTKDRTYELKLKLYEFEEAYRRQKFFRCSKSVILNLMKVDSVRPILNGRFSAKLQNREEVVISRQYVPALKEILSGGAV